MNAEHIACTDATVIPSTDGVAIVMHDFGGTGSPVLLSHATGFHAHCWEPMATTLSTRHHVMALDHRGYGDAETVDPATIGWQQYGNDALAAARHLSAQHNGAPIVGVGHSMGGASLLMAAQREPQLFTALFVFEPMTPLTKHTVYIRTLEAPPGVSIKCKLPLFDVVSWASTMVGYTDVCPSGHIECILNGDVCQF